MGSYVGMQWSFPLFAFNVFIILYVKYGDFYGRTVAITSYISFMEVIENFLLLSISNLRGVKASTTINRFQERFDIYIMAFTRVGLVHDDKTWNCIVF